MAAITNFFACICSCYSVLYLFCHHRSPHSSTDCRDWWYGSKEKFRLSCKEQQRPTKKMTFCITFMAWTIIC